jgi:undecaprenyl-diphosphatase
VSAGEEQLHQSHLFDAFDLPILRFLASFGETSRLFDHMLNAISRIDLFKGVVLMCLFWYAWAQSRPGESGQAREDRQVRLTRTVIGTILLGTLSRVLQILLPIHERPVLSDLGIHFPATGFTEELSNWNSFPSDHSVFFFALATGLWSVNRRVGLIALLWTIFVIDLPRMYLGLHYPSDIVAGALLGFAGMRAILALPSTRPDRQIATWRHEHAAAFLAGLFFLTEQAAHLMGDLRDLAGSFLHVLRN